MYYHCRCIQRRSPWIVSSPNWCVLWKHNGESVMHLFVQCPFAGSFWKLSLSSFNWPTAMPGDLLTLMESLHIGPPFSKEKELLWLNFHKTFFWLIWLERDQHSLDNKAINLESCFHHLSLIALSWCQLSPIFNSYSITNSCPLETFL